LLYNNIVHTIYSLSLSTSIILVFAAISEGISDPKTTPKRIKNREKIICEELIPILKSPIRSGYGFCTENPYKII
jgi:hypothetical protein